MNKLIPNESTRMLISEYMDNELSAEQRAHVEQLLEGSEECRKYYNELQGLQQSLYSWNNEDLSPDGENAINQKIQREDNTMKISTRINAYRIGGTLVTMVLVLVIGTQVKQKFLTKKIIIDQRQNIHTAGDKFNLGKTEIKPVAETIDLHTANEPHRAKTSAKIKINQDKNSQNISAPVSVDQPAQISPMAKAVHSSEIANLAPASRSVGRKQEAGYAGDTLGQSIVWNGPAWNTEQYDHLPENQFKIALENPLSTFSIDVDTASYSNIRRFLNAGSLPPIDSVRIEEMINYFTYDYPQPTGNDPFSVNIEAAACPWNPKHYLAAIGLQGKMLTETPKSNLVFLIDVSGSMQSTNKLPLLKEAYKLMVNQLQPDERVAIVTYAGQAGLVLESTPASERQTILNAIDRLQAGGSTAGGAGIQLAYDVAQKNFIENGNNRVILATDGDFNVGVSSDGELVRIIEEKREHGVFLSVLSFGTGNTKDSRMEKIADKGNGNYFYIDTINEARKVLVHELGSMLFTIAKDVKLQIEFNPSQVKAYRLVGYENRVMANEDFNDDTKDAGELGAGHTVTALYEIVPADSKKIFKGTDPLKYQTQKINSSKELMTVKLRYKHPQAEESQLITRSVDTPDGTKGLLYSHNFQWAAAVAEFGMLLRQSEHKGQANWNSVLTNAGQSKGADPWGYRSEMIDLIKKARGLAPTSTNGYNFKQPVE